MKYFLNELRIIPRVVWPIALLAGGGALYMFFTTPYGRLAAGEIFFAAWGALFLFAWVLLIGYINADARRRGMRYVMWTLLTIFIPPYGIGAILYFVLREPLLISCPKCGARGRSVFVFCPQCGAELSRSCPVCKRAVEGGWNRCAYCGTKLSL